MQRGTLDIHISRAAAEPFVRTTWGEAARIRQTSAGSGGRLSVIDYRAPAGFGPPRHVHREDDETFIIHRGRLVLWSPDGFSVAEAGEMVFLPREKPHTWQNVSEEELEVTLIVTPGEFEPFFPLLSKGGFTLNDVDEINRITDIAGMDTLGPPLSKQEVMASLSET